MLLIPALAEEQISLHFVDFLLEKWEVQICRFLLPNHRYFYFIGFSLLLVFYFCLLLKAGLNQENDWKSSKIAIYMSMKPSIRSTCKFYKERFKSIQLWFVIIKKNRFLPSNCFGLKCCLYVKIKQISKWVTTENTIGLARIQVEL